MKRLAILMAAVLAAGSLAGCASSVDIRTETENTETVIDRTIVISPVTVPAAPTRPATQTATSTTTTTVETTVTERVVEKKILR